MSSAAPTSGSVLGRALCIVTGTSRGFGRVVARDVARLLMPGSALVIVARSGDDLRTLQAELAESASGVAVKCVVVDLGDVEGPGCVVEASKAAFSEDMDHVILVNNAGRWHSHINRFDSHFLLAPCTPDITVVASAPRQKETIPQCLSSD